MIRSFRDTEARKIFERSRSRRIPPSIARVALRKLLLLDAAESLDDLRIPPGNRLEKLTGNRAGRYNIRINEQWRICFEWSSAGADQVEIVDYH